MSLQGYDMESKVRKEAIKAKPEKGNVALWKMLNSGKHDYLSRGRRIELSFPSTLLLSDRGRCSSEESKLYVRLNKTRVSCSGEMEDNSV